PRLALARGGRAGGRLDQGVELTAEAGQDLVVGEGPARLRPPFEVDVGAAAPEAQVRVVRLPGAVHAAAHHRDGEGVPLRVDRHLLDRLRQLHELFVLDARAGRAGD